jgi:hypothetical protein
VNPVGDSVLGNLTILSKPNQELVYKNHEVMESVIYGKGKRGTEPTTSVPWQNLYQKQTNSVALSPRANYTD